MNNGIIGSQSGSPSGAQLRDQGVADVLDADQAVHRGAREHIERVMNELIEQGRPFTSDDVHERLPDDVQPHSPHLIPALFRSYRIAKRIRQVGWATSARPTRHAAVIRQWLGAVALESPDVPDQRRVRSGETPTQTPSSDGVQLPLI